MEDGLPPLGPQRTKPAEMIAERALNSSLHRGSDPLEPAHVSRRHGRPYRSSLPRMNTGGHTQSSGKRTMNEHSRLASPEVHTPLSGHRLALQRLCSCRTEASRRISPHTKGSPGSPFQSIPKLTVSISTPKLSFVAHRVLKTRGEVPMPLWWGTDPYPLLVPDSSRLP